MLFGKYINKFYKKYFWYFLAGLIALIVVDYVQLVVPEALGRIVDIFNDNNINDYIDEIWKLVIEIIVVALIMLLARSGWRLAIFTASKGIESDLREDMFSKAMQLSTRYYHSTSVGNILSIFTTDTDVIQEFFGWGTIEIIDASFLSIFVLVKMFKLDLLLTIITLIPIILIVIWGLLVEKWENILWLESQNKTDKLYNFAQESFAGIRVVKAFVKETKELHAFSKVAKKNMDASIKFTRVSVAFNSAIEIIIALIDCLILGFGGWFVYSAITGNPLVIFNYEISLSPGNLITFAGYFDILIWPMMALGQIFTLRSRAKASLERISNFLDSPVEIKDKENALSLINARGKLSFKNFSFAYPENQKEVLKNITFTINEGETIGVVGKIGCGKSTLFSSLLRFYNLNSNEVFIDDKDVMDIKVHDLRNAVAYVSQDNFLFSDSIKNNIGFGKDASSEENIKNAAKFASINENIESFKDGYETISGERGVTLSGGQRQRISIARAYLKDAPILILDDSVSAVDLKTEEEIIANIKNYRKGKTTVVIASRVSTVESFDKILVLNNGELEAFDTPERLKEISPTYKKMVYLQKLEDEVKGS